MLQKKKHLKNSSVNLILLFKYSRCFYYSDIYECPLAEMISFDLSEKCCLKLTIFTSPIFQVITSNLIDSDFIFGSKKEFG